MSQVLPFKPKTKEVRKETLLANIQRTTTELNNLTAELQQMMKLLAELEAKQ